MRGSDPARERPADRDVVRNARRGPRFSRRSLLREWGFEFKGNWIRRMAASSRLTAWLSGAGCTTACQPGGHERERSASSVDHTWRVRVFGVVMAKLARERPC